jgi:hypothetical protein
MDGFSLVGRETTQLLSDRSRLGIDLQFVLGQLSRDSRHIRRLPCEYVSVILQKLDERCWGRASVRRRSHAKKQLRLKPSQGDGRRFLLWSFGITNRHRDRMTFLSIII